MAAPSTNTNTTSINHTSPSSSSPLSSFHHHTNDVMRRRRKNQHREHLPQQQQQEQEQKTTFPVSAITSYWQLLRSSLSVEHKEDKDQEDDDIWIVPDNAISHETRLLVPPAPFMNDANSYTMLDTTATTTISTSAANYCSQTSLTMTPFTPDQWDRHQHSVVGFVNVAKTNRWGTTTTPSPQTNNNTYFNKSPTSKITSNMSLTTTALHSLASSRQIGYNENDSSSGALSLGVASASSSPILPARRESFDSTALETVAAAAAAPPPPPALHEETQNYSGLIMPRRRSSDISHESFSEQVVDDDDSAAAGTSSLLSSTMIDNDPTIPPPTSTISPLVANEGLYDTGIVIPIRRPSDASTLQTSTSQASSSSSSSSSSHRSTCVTNGATVPPTPAATRLMEGDDLSLLSTKDTTTAIDIPLQPLRRISSLSVPESLDDGPIQSWSIDHNKNNNKNNNNEHNKSNDTMLPNPIQRLSVMDIREAEPIMTTDPSAASPAPTAADDLTLSATCRTSRSRRPSDGMMSKVAPSSMRTSANATAAATATTTTPNSRRRRSSMESIPEGPGEDPTILSSFKSPIRRLARPDQDEMIVSPLFQNHLDSLRLTAARLNPTSPASPIGHSEQEDEEVEQNATTEENDDEDDLLYLANLSSKDMLPSTDGGMINFEHYLKHEKDHDNCDNGSTIPHPDIHRRTNQQQTAWNDSSLVLSQRRESLTVKEMKKDRRTSESSKESLSVPSPFQQQEQDKESLTGIPPTMETSMVLTRARRRQQQQQDQGRRKILAKSEWNGIYGGIIEECPVSTTTNPPPIPIRCCPPTSTDSRDLALDRRYERRHAILASATTKYRELPPLIETTSRQYHGKAAAKYAQALHQVHATTVHISGGSSHSSSDEEQGQQRRRSDTMPSLIHAHHDDDEDE